MEENANPLGFTARMRELTARSDPVARVVVNERTGTIIVGKARDGPGTVSRLGGRGPDFPETRRYVKNVLDRCENLGGGTHLASLDP